MVSNMFYGWLVIALLFLIAELGNPGLFFFLSFCLGALAAGFLTLVTENIVAQSLLFLTGSIIAGVVLIVCFKKRMRQSHYATNAHALIGKHAFVIQTIHPEQAGQVKVGGEIWSARALNSGKIEKEAVVEVVAIRGVHVLVKKIEGLS